MKPVRGLSISTVSGRVAPVLKSITASRTQLLPSAAAETVMFSFRLIAAAAVYCGVTVAALQLALTVPTDGRPRGALRVARTKAPSGDSCAITSSPPPVR